DGLERLDDLLRRPLAELLTPARLKIIAMSHLGVVSRVARIRRQVFDAEAAADVLERIGLERADHHDVPVERRERARQRKASPVETLAKIEPRRRLLELHREDSVEHADVHDLPRSQLCPVSTRG